MQYTQKSRSWKARESKHYVECATTTLGTNAGEASVGPRNCAMWPRLDRSILILVVFIVFLSLLERPSSSNIWLSYKKEEWKQGTGNHLPVRPYRILLHTRNQLQSVIQLDQVRSVEDYSWTYSVWFYAVTKDWQNLNREIFGSIPLYHIHLLREVQFHALKLPSLMNLAC